MANCSRAQATGKRIGPHTAVAFCKTAAYTQAVNRYLEDLLTFGRCQDIEGKERRVTGAITRGDALILQAAVRDCQARTTLETGVAFGVSTLAICDALAQGGPDWHHYGVDPEQRTVHGSCALENLRRAGLAGNFELLEGPSHAMLPGLLERGVVLDLGFIDGWHTFDYTLLDFFYIDKLLRPGGLVLLHDVSLPAKRKVIRFILTHRRYQLVQFGMPEPVTFRRWARRIAAAKFHWLRGGPLYAVWQAVWNQPDIAVLKKLEEFEPGHRFFRRF